MSETNIVSENFESTVITEYTPAERTSEDYQSEADLEAGFIEILQDGGYEYPKIKSSKDLVANLRKQLAKVNDYEFSDEEWNRLFEEHLGNKNNGLEAKAEMIQDKTTMVSLKLDNGSSKNITLIHKNNIHSNILQVINQYNSDASARANRYDVVILVNGIPMVLVELKRRGTALREAFNQIDRYQKESFEGDYGLFEFAQLFVISNGTHTKYYSNTTRLGQVKEKQSFEFTSWWTDGNNRRIGDLVDFAKTFFSKHSLLSVLTKYCVLNTDKKLLVLRPYQIKASENIINKIIMATNSKQLGSVNAGGYIWHTTGSGKTLTSFKTAILASKLDYIDKVIFVVDRKDLDYQTVREYDNFQKGAVNSNSSTKELEEQLNNKNSEKKIVITTIQKLNIFVTNNKSSNISNCHVVLIFDECHRSQFGDMRKRIAKFFKKYHIFGFTGTPIFKNTNFQTQTTEQLFGQRLHKYTIVDAIQDENVLKFKVDYFNSFKMKNEINADEKVIAIDTKSAENHPERIKNNVSYIIENFDKNTYKDSKKYNYNVVENINEMTFNKNRAGIKEERKSKEVCGFNSILATSSIEAAKLYYKEFMEQQKETPEYKKLKIALIYSSISNKEDNEDLLQEEESYDTSEMDQLSKNFLENAIKDYNNMFGTNYSINSNEFENYYKNLSYRVKNREVDILIVVNMFLTGFDAPTLNTLWVDKNLKHHGLIQAFSRTNRILNKIKAFGNIVCFRNLDEEVNEALKLYGDGSGKITLIRTYKELYNGYEDNEGNHQKGYRELIEELQEKFPLCEEIIGKNNEHEFIKLYGAILKLRSILNPFDEFEEDKEILSNKDFKDYKSKYLDFHDKLRKHNINDKAEITDDLVFELEFIKRVDIGIEYILQLINEYNKSDKQDEKILTEINRDINSNIGLRNKKQLIQNFINEMNVDSNISSIEEDWRTFVNKNKEKELEEIIKTENLKPEQTREFIKNAFRDGEFKTAGNKLSKILPPTPLFDENNKESRIGEKQRYSTIEKLYEFFEKYFGI